MWIDGVDFDGRLIKALHKQSLNARHEQPLVVFAGAGVSIGPPSNYPDFKGLTLEIAKWSGYEWDSKNEAIDRFLGRLDQNGIKIHQQVAERLSSPVSRPTALHENILKLFGRWDHIRIVTTNFDAHFETAAVTIYGQKPIVFRAPALPLGNDFAGIVCLHGSVRDDPKRLILTDRDFGRTYLTEGWATRFLLSLFGRYTVLFVGYSHDDIVMHYLSRGLPPDKNGLRFALVRADDDLQKWDNLGIKALSFPFEGRDDYIGLDKAFAGFVAHANRGILEIEQRIKTLVEGLPTSLDDEARDFLVDALTDIVSVRFFTHHAKKPEWLAWVSERPLLSPLFSQGDLTEIDQDFMDWIAQNFAVEHPDAVFAVMNRHSKTPHPRFMQGITGRLAYSRDVPDREVISKWIPLLLEFLPFVSHRADQSAFSYILKLALRQGAFAAAVQLLDHLTRPYSILKEAIAFPDENDGRKIEMEIGFCGDYHTLKRVWDKEGKPHLPDLAFLLWPALVQNLNQSFLLSCSWGMATAQWDPLSMHRSAIEPHDQDQFPHSEDLLIDAARDCLEWALENSPEVGQAWIDAAAAMEPLLLRRLAVHGMGVTTHKDGNTKIRWLIDKGFLFIHWMKHEVFQLLKKAYPGADPALRKALLTIIEEGIDARPEKDEEAPIRKAYKKSGFFHWLSQADPDCREVADRLADIRQAHAGIVFEPEAHPDLNYWMSSGGFGHRSPHSVEELLGKRPAEWWKFIVDYRGDPFEGPGRDGLLGTIREAVQQDFAWGQELADLLIEHADPASDLWRNVLHGWWGARLSTAQWKIVLTTMNSEGLTRNHVHDIADLLLMGVEKKEGIPVRLLSLADRVAKQVWAVLANEDGEMEDRDRLGRAIDHPAGKLAEFWLNTLSRGRKKTDPKQGMPKRFRDRFTMIISDGGNAGALGRAVLASQLRFLFSVDEAWTKTHLIPLMDWERDALVARQAWSGWLAAGRPTEPLLTELLPYYRKAFHRLASELREEGERFTEHVTYISLFFMDDPRDNGWLWEFLKATSNEDRIHFASEIGRHLTPMSNEVKKGLWDRWLKSYWQGRNQGIPCLLSNGELCEMVKWVVELEPVFTEAVEGIRNGRVPHFDNTSMFYRLEQEKKDMVKRIPEAVARLLVHLTSDAQMPRYFCHELEPLVDQLISAGAPQRLLEKLCENLAAIGCPNTSNLLNNLGNNLS
ncbi:MAG: hypothetical protein A2X92_09745 [Syntrophus sp. GWC2_56_31]|nr:MAG: hypothetical protein A2X92_09745 [Syntrophus sp. GWC2_56_31]